MIDDKKLAAQFAAFEIAMKNPEHRLETLLHAMRSESLAACKLILEANPEAIINTPSDMTENDINHLMKRTGLSRDVLHPKFTTQCPPIFYAVLYNFFEIFEFIHKKKASLDAKTAAGVDLATFARACKASSRIQVYLSVNATNPSNPFGDHIAPSETDDTELECLVIAAQSGNIVLLNKCIVNKVHDKDMDGTAMEQAVRKEKLACVFALANTNLHIHARHYVFSGMASKVNSEKLYDLMIKNDKAKLPVTTADLIPNFIKRENLEGLHQRFDTPVDNATKSKWLFYAVYSGKILITRYLLEKGAVVEPMHYHAAGRYARYCVENYIPEMANERLSRMLVAADPKQCPQPLPANFYTSAEENAYARVVTPGNANNNAGSGLLKKKQ